MEFAISSLPAGAKRIIQNNPYFTLGLGSFATSSDANSVVKKIKQLDRLNATSSYKTEFDLSGIEAPNRNLSSVQVALDILEKEGSKWLWFSNASVECGGNSFRLNEPWQEIMQLNLSLEDSYDAFLLYFLALLIYDAQFQQTEKWNHVFSYIEKVLVGNPEQLDAIIDVLSDAVRSLSVNEQCHVLRIMNAHSGAEIAKEMISVILPQITMWASSSITELKNLNEELSKQYVDGQYSVITMSDALRLLHTMAEYDSRHWDEYESILRIFSSLRFENVSVYREKILQEVIPYINWTRIKLQNACFNQYEKEAAYFYSKIYDYYIELYPEYKNNSFQGYPLVYLDIDYSCYSNFDLVSKGRYECSNNRLQIAQRIIADLENRKSAMQYVLKFDYYVKLCNYHEAAKVFAEVKNLLALHTSENEYFDVFSYMYMTADLYDFFDLLGVERSKCSPNLLDDKDSAEKKCERGIELYKANASVQSNLQAWFLLMKSYKQGCTKAAAWIAECYMNNRVMGGDVMMTNLFLREGMRENPWCCYHYGDRLRKGMGVARDVNRGMTYISYAGKNGDTYAKEFMENLKTCEIPFTRLKTVKKPHKMQLDENAYAYIQEFDVKAGNNLHMNIWFLNKKNHAIQFKVCLSSTTAGKDMITSVYDVGAKELSPVKLDIELPLDFSADVLSYEFSIPDSDTKVAFMYDQLLGINMMNKA